MKLFSPLYRRVMFWVRHRHAQWYLAGLSFAESSFFPIPPDVMLAPMSLAQPKRALFFAALTTVASVLGGILGYLIGQFAFELVEPLIREWGYWGKYSAARDWFDTWGFWAVLLAGFSPIPYKLFTIAAGTVAMPFIPFLFASIIGRGARFFLVALLMAWGGERMEKMLHDYVDTLGWVMVGAVLLVYFLI